MARKQNFPVLSINNEHTNNHFDTLILQIHVFFFLLEHEILTKNGFSYLIQSFSTSDVLYIDVLNNDEFNTEKIKIHCLESTVYHLKSLNSSCTVERPHHQNVKLKNVVVK